MSVQSGHQPSAWSHLRGLFSFVVVLALLPWLVLAGKAGERYVASQMSAHASGSGTGGPSPIPAASDGGHASVGSSSGSSDSAGTPPTPATITMTSDATDGCDVDMQSVTVPAGAEVIFVNSPTSTESIAIEIESVPAVDQTVAVGQAYTWDPIQLGVSPGSFSWWCADESDSTGKQKYALTVL